MDPRHYGLVEMAFTGIVVLSLAGWQLVSVNRAIRRDRDAPENESPEGARHPIGEHRLDDR